MTCRPYPAPPAAGRPHADPHAGHDMSAMPAPATGTSPPPPPADHAAERFFDPEAMERARGVLRAEHGGARVTMLMSNILEYGARSGEDGYRWDAEGWYGGDINRAVVKTEGEGGAGDGLDAGEVEALYSRARSAATPISRPGCARTSSPGPSRTYATVGFSNT